MSTSLALASTQPATAATDRPRAERFVRLGTGSLPWVLHGMAAAVCFGLVDSVALGVVAYPLVLTLLAGLVARTGLAHIRPGRFDRDPLQREYRGRLVYGAALTTMLACRPVMHLLLGCAPLKGLFLRLFGYRGSLDVTLYADTWMRDLAVLDFGPGTYVASRVTLGTNIVQGKRILVGSIRTGRDVVIGFGSLVGPGAEIGDGTDIGQESILGMRVRIGKGVTLEGRSNIHHGARIHDGVVIGALTYVGKRAVIHAGLHVPAGSFIPDRAVIRNEADLQRVIRAA